MSELLPAEHPDGTPDGADARRRHGSRGAPGRPCGELTITSNAERFAAPLLIGARVGKRLPGVLSRSGVAGGAVYDAAVALAAIEHGCPLATRDARAKATYEALGAEVLVVA